MPDQAAKQPEAQLEQGAYEIIQKRLADHGRELRSRLDQLNEARMSVFGSIETKLVGAERVTTSNNCVPRDMVPIGDRFLFGYNVQFGLRTEIELADVFSVYRFDGSTFHEEPLELIGDERFKKDFRDLYRFYKNTAFAKFFRSGPHIYMKFHVGNHPDDFKAFKWLSKDGRLTYIDNRSDHEVRYPDQHELDWVRVTRDDFVTGQHPHASIQDRVFVETVGGDLTIKVENNTAAGAGIYAEPVDDPDQTLDDADITYIAHGHLILLRIRPYQESNYRYFIFNEKLQNVVRLDAIEHACILLPDDQGLIFADGYYLADGRTQTFPTLQDLTESMVFERRIAAPNGEDFLYVFYNRTHGVYVLLSYNLIEQQIDTPTLCNGYSFFSNGELIFFKAGEEPQKHHAIQIWQTPYVGPNYVPEKQSDTYLSKIGNKEIVRGMAECVGILNLIRREERYADLYVDIVKATSDLLDSFFWLGHSECFNLAETLTQIKDAGLAAVGEFEKVTRVRRATEAHLKETSAAASELINRNASRIYESIHSFVESLASLREIRGKIISLRDLRYIDETQVNALEVSVQDQTESLSRRTVDFLLQPDALSPYEHAVKQQADRIDSLTKAADASELDTQITSTSNELEMLIDIVSNLKIDDATQRTAILDSVSIIFSELNAARSRLRNKNQDLGRSEGIAEFNSQLKLLNQSVINYLDLCDTAEKTDQYLTKMMVQIEEVEGRFAEFDDFVLQLTEKRDEIYNAFENRKLQITEKRNKRSTALAAAADRILRGIKSRVDGLDTVNAINSYFASDLMVEKLRDLIDELSDLEDTVKVDDIHSQIKTIREDAVRQLKDRQELMVDGPNTIRFGKHVFSVNTQAVDLTMVLRDDRMNLHISGTRFFEPIEDEALNSDHSIWTQEIVSENPDVYRSEYLAYLMSIDSNAVHLADLDDNALLAHTQKFMSSRYSEGYIKGVHDHDSSKILKALMELDGSIGLLRYPSESRAMAGLYWRTRPEDDDKRLMTLRLCGYGAISGYFPENDEQGRYIDDIRHDITAFNDTHQLFNPAKTKDAGVYLFHELTTGNNRFVASPEAAALYDAFLGRLKTFRAVQKFQRSLDNVADQPVTQFLLACDWLRAFLETNEIDPSKHEGYLSEAALMLLDKPFDHSRIVQASVARTIENLTGSHQRIIDGVLELNYNEFTNRLDRFVTLQAPAFEQYTHRKRMLAEQAREEMRLDEFKPRVLTSFVRNKLIDKVFLPLIGDNLAKQMGSAGENTRTDRMGMLLLISPPGYGKTTLMEYIANRLGVIFMKINGPAIGHSVTSLDPQEASNAAARDELNKLNLAFEMGDNVMIYVDDIQHCSSEFLQKFISLCDAQRKIEGVYKGRPRTYDFRGRKVAVVMAGNPYTESGEKFHIPDMLANRADTYNLGDIIGDHRDAFVMSYLENALTSNPALNQLASRSQEDVYSIIKIAETNSRDDIDFEGNYSSDEINEMVGVMRKLMRVRDVILAVNQEYIRSAGMETKYRTEPAFGLQGSYRNMNRIAEKVSSVMNDDELQTLILSSYEQDAQTLTTGAEANLLKFKELIGIINDQEQGRWEEIKKTFRRNNHLAGIDGDDRTAQVLVQLASFNEGLDEIHQAISTGLSAKDQTELVPLMEQVTRLNTALASIGEAIDASRVVEAKLDEETIDAIRAAAASRPVPPPKSGQESPPHEIRVVNKVPSTFLYVMKEQFNLMKGWLEPLTRITADQDGQLKQLGATLQDMVTKYDTMIAKLERSRSPEE